MDETIVVARAVVRLFEKWDLLEHEQLQLLCLSSSDVAVLHQKREGRSGLQSDEMRVRAAQLLSIHKALRLLYPRNTELLYGWVRMRNENFGGKTPLAVMLAGDVERVKRTLEQLVKR